MDATNTMTLLDYVNERESVVIWWAGVGQPTGEYTLAGHPDWDFAESRGFFELNGTVDERGRWQWDGDGRPTDWNGNTIYKLEAYEDADTWASMAESE